VPIVAAIAVSATASAVASSATGSTPTPRTRAFLGEPNPRDLDLGDLVPKEGRIDGVWYVPAGRTRPQVAVAWHFLDRRPVLGWTDHRRYVLTLWSPQRLAAGEARWEPHTLIRASPFALAGKSVRLADVTGDGHDDLLVTVMCEGCNHATAVVSVYATFGSTVRRILGSGVIGVAKGAGRDVVVHGREITETAWGARRGLVWFDQPLGTFLSGHRLQTFMRWTDKGWRTVLRRRVDEQGDRLIVSGYPPP
jgi:hypothetical protein